jgi:hypothetical protein
MRASCRADAIKVTLRVPRILRQDIYELALRRTATLTAVLEHALRLKLSLEQLLVGGARLLLRDAAGNETELLMETIPIETPAGWQLDQGKGRVTSNTDEP